MLVCLLLRLASVSSRKAFKRWKGLRQLCLSEGLTAKQLALFKAEKNREEPAILLSGVQASPHRGLGTFLPQQVAYLMREQGLLHGNGVNSSVTLQGRGEVEGLHLFRLFLCATLRTLSPNNPEVEPGSDFLDEGNEV